MLVEPLFSLLAGFAAVAFASAACLEFIRNRESSTFFSVAAGATAFLVFIHLPDTPIQVVMICLLTGIADIAVHCGERTDRHTGEETPTRPR